MMENSEIGNHIITHLLEGENKDVSDPVLLEWLAEDESNRKIFNQYRNIWIQSASYIDVENIDMELAWEKINKINKQKESSHKRFSYIGYALSGVAASLLILFALSLTGLFEKESNVSLSMTVDYGNRSNVVLPDGSVVKLNSGSDLTYSYNSKKNIREVTFQGEGFFDVSKSESPFVIKLENELELKVLGTSFNLSAYNNDPMIRASLVEGCIELNHPNETLVMNAGEMAEFNKEDNEIKRITGDLSYSLGWIDDKLYMDSMSLADVSKYLERRYNVIVTMPKEIGEDIYYSGVIKEDNITDVMEALSRMSRINYQMRGKNISITSK